MCKFDRVFPDCGSAARLEKERYWIFGVVWSGILPLKILDTRGKEQERSTK
jgi:hypothetical protein